MNPIRILMHGASGRMGRAVMRLAATDARFMVAAAVARGPVEVTPPALALAPEQFGHAPPVDLAIDFSLPEALPALLDFCAGRGVALVSGTTGLDDALRARLQQLAQTVAVVHEANFSIGIAVLRSLVRRAAEALPDWDCDLVEAHHVNKKDAPSGTALALGGAIAQARGREPAYHSLRAGDIVGDHNVQFAGPGERLGLFHSAGDRDLFARGALEAAARLSGQGPGSYRLAALLGL